MSDIEDEKLREQIGLAIFGGNELPNNWETDSRIPRVLQLIKTRDIAKEREELYDLDEIENKPWRVFRQLAKLMPEYSDTYGRYERFYAHGGGEKVMKLIDDFEASEEQKNDTK
jgi:hypothetical protein